MGNLTGKTEKSYTAGAFDKAGNVDTICIPLGDVDPTAEKLYRSDPSSHVCREEPQLTGYAGNHSTKAKESL